MRKWWTAIILAVGLALGYGAGTVERTADAQVGGVWTYTEIVNSVDEVAAIIRSDRSMLARAMNLINSADAELGSLSATYGPVGAAIDAALAVDPGNAAYVALDAQWDELVAEFTAVKATSAAQKAALEALP